MIKKDGHTHTEFCPHGTFEPVEKMILNALNLGFKEYSITEHAPLPPAFAANYAGETKGLATAGMAFNDLPLYFKTMEELQKKYARDIKINVGFEVDYLPEHEEWTKDFLNEYGPRTQDGVLSVHFQKGLEGWWCIDYTPEQFEAGLISSYQDFSAIYTEYFNLIEGSLLANLGPFKPKRLGHITLIQKFEQYFKEETSFTHANQVQINQLLQQIATLNYQLDFNTAGLDKPYYQQTYPTPLLVTQAKALQIPLIFGSDAHSIQEVGRHYDVYQKSMLTLN